MNIFLRQVSKLFIVSINFGYKNTKCNINYGISDRINNNGTCVLEIECLPKKLWVETYLHFQSGAAIYI